MSASEYYFDIDLIEGTHLLICAPGDDGNKKITLMDGSKVNGSSSEDSVNGIKLMTRV